MNPSDITKGSPCSIRPKHVQAGVMAEAARQKVGTPGAFRVLLGVGNLRNAPRLIDAALDIIGDERPAEIVISRLLPLPSGGEIRSGLYEEQADQAEIADALAELCERARARGIEAIALSQLSTDFADDLVGQAANLEADAIVVGWNEPEVPDTAVARFVPK